MGMRYVLIASLVVVFSILAGLLISNALQKDGSDGAAAKTQDDSALSAGTLAYLKRAMPQLEKVMRQWNAGQAQKAVATWGAIGDIPASTTADKAMAADYLEYANNVRYYMVGDGSATLKDVEDAKEKAERTLASLRAD